MAISEVRSVLREPVATLTVVISVRRVPVAVDTPLMLVCSPASAFVLLVVSVPMLVVNAVSALPRLVISDARFPAMTPVDVCVEVKSVRSVPVAVLMEESAFVLFVISVARFPAIVPVLVCVVIRSERSDPVATETVRTEATVA